MRSFYGLVPFLLALPGIAAPYETKLPGAQIAAIASDPNGAVYVTGSTSSPLFPATPGVYQFIRRVTSCGHTATGATIPCTDAFAAKINPDGTLAWATFLGGAGNDSGTSITVDSQSNIWVAGTTTSSDFPLTAGVVQMVNNGPIATGSPNDATAPTAGDAFIAKLSPQGNQLLASTFLGGSGADTPKKVAIDASLNVYIIGSTQSTDFPRSENPHLASRAPSFVTKLSSSLQTMLFSTYWEADVADAAVTPLGAVYLTGFAQALISTASAYLPLPGTHGGGYAARLTNDGSAVMFLSYLGSGSPSYGVAVQVDSAATPWFVVRSPSETGAKGCDLVHLHPNGTQALATDHISSDSTGCGTGVWSLAPDGLDRMWLVGSAPPSPFTLTPGAIQNASCPTTQAYFLRRYTSAGALDYSSFLSTPAFGITADSTGSVFIARTSTVYKPSFDAAAAAIQPYCLLNSASFANATLAPGLSFSIFGAGMGPQTGVGPRFTQDGNIFPEQAGTRVLVDGIPAPLLYVRSDQINAIVPFGISGQSTASVTVEVNGVRGQPIERPAQPWAPAIFIMDGRAAGQGAILNADFSLNSAANPAALGSVIAIWGTGTGITNPASTDGRITAYGEILRAVAPVKVIFGQAAPVDAEFAGAAPALVAGVSQINVRLPDSLPAGTNLNAVPISIQIGTDGAVFGPLATVAVH